MTAVRMPTGEELVAVAALWRAAGREVVCSFLGTSMLPTIAPGVEVTIDCGRRWEVGDIIAFIADGRLFVHRLEATSADRRLLLTRGDARTVPDEPFEAADTVIGLISCIHSGEQWIAPQPAPRSWMRAIVLGASLGAFKASPRVCRWMLRLFRRVGVVVR